MNLYSVGRATTTKLLILAIISILIFTLGCNQAKIHPTILYNMAINEKDPLEFQKIWIQMLDHNSRENIPYMIKVLQDDAIRDERFDPIDALIWLQRIPIIYDFNMELFLEDDSYRIWIASKYQNWYSNFLDKTAKGSQIDREVIHWAWRNPEIDNTGLNNKDMNTAIKKGKMEFLKWHVMDKIEYNKRRIDGNKMYAKLIKKHKFPRAFNREYIDKIYWLQDNVPIVYDFDEKQFREDGEYRTDIEMKYLLWYSNLPTRTKVPIMEYDTEWGFFLTPKETEEDISAYMEWRNRLKIGREGWHDK